MEMHCSSVSAQYISGDPLVHSHAHVHVLDICTHAYYMYVDETDVKGWGWSCNGLDLYSKFPDFVVLWLPSLSQVLVIAT